MEKQECRFIFGKAGTNLDDKCIEFIKLDIANPDVEKILVISDDKYKKELEVKIRKENIIDPNLKLNVVTINDLIKRELTARGDKRLKPLTNEQVTAIITHLIYINRFKLTTYKTIDIGLIKKFVKTIELLKGEGISHNNINIDLISEDNILRNKISDINLIYSEYEEFKRNKYLDKYDQLHYYSELIKDDTTHSNIYLYKITEISNVELKAIKNIKREELNIILDTDRVDREPCDESGHFYKSDLYVNKIINELNLHINKIKKIQLDTTNCSNKEFIHLRDELYKYPNRVFDKKTENIFLTETDSISNEVEILIKTLQTINNNYNISIAVANIEEYNNIIKREFLNNEIPFNMDTNLSLNTQPIYKILNLLLDLKEDLTLYKFIQLLKTNYFDIEIRDIYKLEKYLRDKEFLDDNSLINITPDDLLILDDFNKVINIFEDIQKLLLDISKNKTFQDYIKSILNFLTNNGILLKIQNDIKAEIQNENISLTKISWENLVKKINVYSKVLPDEEIDPIEFNIILKTITSEVLQIKDKENKGVNITDINSLQNCDVIFLLGANKGAIQNISNETLLTDSDILKLNKVELLLGEDHISKYSQSQYDIYSILTKAKEKLFISYSTKGIDLAQKEKAPFIGRLQCIFSDLNNCSTQCNNIEQHVPYSFIKDISKFISENYNFEECTNYIDKIKTINNNRHSSDLEAILNALNYRNEALCLDKYNLQELYYSDFLSVSKLEKYAKCPFAYFLEYGLKLKKAEKSTLQAKHIGIALHHIIEEFDKKLKKQNISWDEISDNFIVEEVSNIISKLEQRNVLRTFYKTYSSTYYLKRMNELAVSSIKAIRCHIGNSFFKIEGHEINFNDQGTYPAIPIKLMNGKIIKLQGQIDRLDILKNCDTNYIRIVDYKTGNTSLDFTEVAYGTQLQLLTYLDAILSSNKDYLPAGIFYFKVDDPIIKTTPNVFNEYINESIQKEMKLNGLFIDNADVIKAMDKGIFDGDYNSSINIKARFKVDGTLSKTTPGLTSSELNTLKEYTKKNIEELATRMLVNCEIGINPIKKKSIKPCTYCDYKEVCHFDETLEVNKFKILNEFSKDELLELAYKKVGIKNE